MGSFQSMFRAGSTDNTGRISYPNRRTGRNNAGKETSFVKNTAPLFDDAWGPYLIKRGTFYNEYRIISGPDIQKIPGSTPGSEIWGKYPKIYSTTFGFDNGIFNPPTYFHIDNVRVLCPCNRIRERFYGDESHEPNHEDYLLRLKILSGEIIPACWEDYKSFENWYGDKTFDVYVKHPAFYANVATENLLASTAAELIGIKRGGKKTRGQKTRGQKTRGQKAKKTRRRHTGV